MTEAKKLVCPHCGQVNRVPVERMGEDPKCGTCKKSLLLDKPLELTSANFDRHIQNTDLPILVDFWAAWCGPCKAMAPVIDEAASRLKTVMRVAKLDTEANKDIAARFGIRSIPTLMIFSGGEILDQRAGAMDHRSLLEWLNSVIK